MTGAPISHAGQDRRSTDRFLACVPCDARIAGCADRTDCLLTAILRIACPAHGVRYSHLLLDPSRLPADAESRRQARRAMALADPSLHVVMRQGDADRADADSGGHAPPDAHDDQVVHGTASAPPIEAAPVPGPLSAGHPDRRPDPPGPPDPEPSLLHAVAMGDERLERLLTERARALSGCPDLCILPVGASRADVPGACPIAGDGIDLGTLVAPSLGEDQRRAWAAWSAAWIAARDRVHASRELAYRDDLTGIWNRRYFRLFLDRSITEARRVRRPVTIMLFDIDDFKRYNDAFGHEAGDEILRETVRLLLSTVRAGDRVCRIGGDEFAVVFADLEQPRTAGSSHPDSVEQLAERFRDQIRRARFPKLGCDAPGTVTISAGLATFPWDSHEPEELLRIADARLLESKSRGKNCLTFGPDGAACG